VEVKPGNTDGTISSKNSPPSSDQTASGGNGSCQSFCSKGNLSWGSRTRGKANPLGVIRGAFGAVETQKKQQKKEVRRNQKLSGCGVEKRKKEWKRERIKG